MQYYYENEVCAFSVLWAAFLQTETEICFLQTTINEQISITYIDLLGFTWAVGFVQRPFILIMIVLMVWAKF